MTRFVSAAEAARLLGLHKRTLLYLCQRGLIAGAVRRGAGSRTWRIPLTNGNPVRIAGRRGPLPRA